MIRKISLKGIAVLSIFGCSFAGRTVIEEPVAIKINMVVQSVKHEGDSSVLITNEDYAELLNIDNINILKNPIYLESGQVKNSINGFVDGEVAQKIVYENHLFYINAKYGLKFNPKNQDIGIKFSVDSLLKPYGYDGIKVGNFQLDKEVAEKNLSFEFN